MDKLIKFLQGKKTIIGALLMAIGGLLYGLGIIDKETEDMIRTVAMAIATYGMYDLISRRLK